ncbi:MAG: DNA recombination protein RmuC [Pseudolysinimonas sp.]|uniref:DNA recombination protein RmuC n=1 Tax=Pseudolysinimonas sp. TaxID=2680009 RepID=UPI003265AFE4
MDATLTLLIGLGAGLVLGVLGGWLIARARRSDATAATENLISFRERTAAAESLATARGAQIEALLAEQRAQQARTEEDNKVLQQLAPVQETLRQMSGKVAELERDRATQYGALTEQLSASRVSGEQLRATTESLASALRNNATRGVWGETQLRTLVESAGLINRVDYFLQSTIESESGTRRPDMVINLPGGKSIPVDAKVPYNSYIDASAIPATATGEQEARRQQLLAQHAKQVRNHVDALAGKSYWTGLAASPDFTIAFIPNEPLLAAAMEQDPSLMEYAFSKRIVLANPATLWGLLKTIAFTWQQNVLTEDAKTLFDLGKELYSRLSTLSEHADKLRRSIESTVTNYNQFASSLEQRVLVTARKLDVLDESKVIGTPGTIETQPKSLSQMEFAALDETGIGRAELDLGLVNLETEATIRKPKTA